MVKPRKLRQADLKAEPFLAWNEFVDILAMSERDEFTPVQLKAHFVFWYESEVQNGGHLQYFENRGVTRVAETIQALRSLKAANHAAVLEQAYSQFRSRARNSIATVEQFVDAALEDEFGLLDSAFHDAPRTLVDHLEDYLRDNMSDFIEIECERFPVTA